MQSTMTVALLLVSQAAAWAANADTTDIRRLTAELHSGNIETRTRAARTLGERHAEQAVEGLIAALDDADWQVREAAARSLGQIRDLRAVAPLLSTLDKDESWSVRQVAAAALGRIGDRRAVEPLLEATGVTDWLLRLAAIEALGEIGDPRAADAVARILTTEDEFFHRAAVATLARFRDRRCLASLLEVLKSGDADGREAAALALGRIGDAGSVDPLIGALNDAETPVRSAAAMALGNLRDRRATAALTVRLKDADFHVRWCSLWALGFIRDTRAAPEIVPLLKDRDWSLRVAAAYALAATGAPRGAEALIEAHAVETYNALWFSALGLGRLNEKRAADTLLARVTQTGPPLLWMRAHATLEALIRLKDAGTMDRLIAALDGGDRGSRGGAALTLGATGDARAIGPLGAALTDADKDVRLAAVMALGRLADPRASKALVKALKDDQEGVRAEAARALGRMPNVDAVVPLLTILDTEDEATRAAAAEALGAADDHRAVAALRAALTDRAWIVRDAAATALERLTGRDPLAAARGANRPVVAAGDAEGNPVPGWARISRAQVDAARTAGVPPALEVVLSDGVTVRLVYIPAGTFRMGSPDVLVNAPHDVTIKKGFYLGLSPVTVGQFKHFVEESGYRTDAERSVGYEGGLAVAGSKGDQDRHSDVSWRNPLFEQTDRHPVVAVSWNDSTAFCRWLSRKTRRPFRLPTDAEWEYACRAGRSSAESRYPWGPAYPPPENVGNYCDQEYKATYPRHSWAWHIHTSRDGYVFTAPVGTYRPNPWGLYDMGGNVSQWCSDWYRTFFDEADVPAYGTPPTGYLRVRRGVHWFNSTPVRLQSAYRDGSWPWERMTGYGFRVVADAPRR